MPPDLQMIYDELFGRWHDPTINQRLRELGDNVRELMRDEPEETPEGSKIQTFSHRTKIMTDQILKRLDELERDVQELKNQRETQAPKGHEQKVIERLDAILDAVRKITPVTIPPTTPYQPQNPFYTDPIGTRPYPLPQNPPWWGPHEFTCQDGQTVRPV